MKYALIGSTLFNITGLGINVIATTMENPFNLINSICAFAFILWISKDIENWKKHIQSKSKAKVSK